MAESKVTLPTQAEVDAQEEADLKKKGSQRQDCRAWADKDSMVSWTLPERVVKHFKIDLLPADMTGEVKEEGTGGEEGKKHPISGADFGRPGQKIMKAIRIPCGKTDPIVIRRRGGDKTVKSVLVRVPASMNVNAIVVWINNQFKQNVPTSFITPGKLTAYIHKDFKDKSKIGQHKEG